MRKLISYGILMLGAVFAAPSFAVDYTEGVFVVNEDWYGHQNSTVNYLRPDADDGEFWQYRVIQAENPGMELGCTNQYGVIFNDRFYLIAKQAKDPGASVTGGRITVVDAGTMKILHQSELIDPSGKTCDGRGFIGVTEHKGYVSTSNGIWILDLDTYEVTGQVEGTANPNPRNLYKGQCGSMVEADGRIFAAHQSLGLIVIDPDEDTVTDIVSLDCVADKAGIGSVVKSKDGYLWLSVSPDTNGTGSILNYLVRVSPTTLETEVIELPEGISGPSNSWYAWTPDSFCASTLTNTLFWGGGSSSRFANQKIYRYDIDSREASLIIDLEADGELWKLYGCSMRVHPRTDEIYMSLYHEFVDQTYITRRYTTDGDKIRDYQMIANYWFPSLFVFPEKKQGSVLEEIGDTTESIDSESETTYYDMTGNRLLDRPTAPGIYIRHSPTKTTKILVQ